MYGSRYWPTMCVLPCARGVRGVCAGHSAGSTSSTVNLKFNINTFSMRHSSRCPYFIPNITMSVGLYDKKKLVCGLRCLKCPDLAPPGLIFARNNLDCWFNSLGVLVHRWGGLDAACVWCFQLFFFQIPGLFIMKFAIALEQHNGQWWKTSVFWRPFFPLMWTHQSTQICFELEMHTALYCPFLMKKNKT